MKTIKVCFIALSVFALTLVSGSTFSQSTGNPEFSPLRTSRQRPPERSLTPQTKFIKAQNAIPNKYVVVLNDDVVSDQSPAAARRAKVAAVADTLARVHAGKVGFVYETALKGFSIELPNEAAAIALSQDPQVRFVEENALLHTTAVQPTHRRGGWIESTRCFYRSTTSTSTTPAGVASRLT